ncbi:SLC13 family permease [Wansuia hejianensis]|uniref:SLC13 family permease n=1 Tax=Wansuia hejianensis TaxID=2763667 RepID=A0A926F2H8_9FIRM|nr:SLC13 family permease [Wansuia hejianensis]MBC8590797.1 SLC13 family permease [Wansuia hejianensis]
MYHQIIVFIVLGATFFFFIDGRIRYEFVGLSGLLILTIAGVITPEEAFTGFSHPAVITVASVLVISSALIKSGVVEHLVIFLNKGSHRVSLKVLGLMIVTASLSAFMNNVGALALILPIGLRVAKDSKISPSSLLMPVSFASLFGGMITSIGTPPNLIVSAFRVQGGGEPFDFFDFAPVAMILVPIGIGFTSLLGWRVIPKRKFQEEKDKFNIEGYLSEVVVTDSSKMVGRPLKDFYGVYKLEVNVLSIIRDGRKILAPRGKDRLLAGDILIIKSVPTELTDLVKRTGMTLKGSKPEVLESEPYLKYDEVALVEVVLREDSLLIGRTVLEVRLRNRFNVNLIAVSRKGTSSVERLKSFRFKSGDILLMQAPVSILEDIYSKLGCLPLAERGVGIDLGGRENKRYLPLIIFLISIIITGLGLLPVQVSFSIAAVSLVIFNIISPRVFYDAIEWPTIIMLGSLLPMGAALQSSGGSDTIAKLLVKLSTIFSPSLMIVVVMLLTMILTNLISNSAAAVLMAPISFSLANFMGVSSDPFLMSVAVASSSAFMTPIGHQSNMLVMGPGGYKFTDYWKLGLPLSIIVLTLGAPLILYFWPL